MTRTVKIDIMENAEKSLAEFNQLAIGALDEVFVTIESDTFLHADVRGVTNGLDRYLRQVRRIKQAAGEAKLAGLQWVCALIEKNLGALHTQSRLLTREEYALLTEWPELLARYALNQSNNKVDTLIRHLTAQSWPAPLQEVDSAALRKLLSTDSIEEELQSHCGEEPGPNLIAADRTTMVLSTVSTDHNQEQALLQSIDGLIETVANWQSSALGVGSERQYFESCSQHLTSVASACYERGLDTLTEVCAGFAQTLEDRAALDMAPNDLECDMLQRFSLLLLDAIGENDTTPAVGPLIEIACNICWFSPEATEILPENSLGEVDNELVAFGGGSDSQTLNTSQIAPDETITPIDEISRQKVDQDLLGLMTKEFTRSRRALDEDLSQAINLQRSPDERALSWTNYLDGLAHLATASEAIGMLGLRDYLTLLHGLLHPNEVTDVNILNDLPQDIANYLASPTDMECAGELIVILSHVHDSNPRNIAHSNGNTLSVSEQNQWLSRLTQIDLVSESQDASEEKRKVGADDVSLALPQDTNQELLDGLLLELPIQVGTFAKAIDHIRRGSATHLDLEHAKRAAHTLKGAANTVGVAGIANLTHAIEDLLLALSEQGTMPDASLAQLLVDASDCLEAMSESVLESSPPPIDALRILQSVIDYGHTGEYQEHQAQESREASEHPAPDASDSNSSESQTGSLQSGAPADQVMRVPAAVVDELLRLAGENIISNSQIQERLKSTQLQSKAILKQDILLQKLIQELENLVEIRGIGTARRNAPADGDFDPLEFERYGELHTLTSQLLEASTDAREMSGQVEEQLQELGEMLELQRRLQIENQHAVVRTRLVSVSTISARLHRCVRQTSRLLDKAADLVIEGESTSIDSNLLHSLVDPLMHILRNAVDHGIEIPEKRLAAHKPERGAIKLSFAREGNSILVRCQDDGAGLDYSAIRRAAVRRGLLSATHEPSLDELHGMLLIPGFSTREETTQTSGRGIGMDAVHAAILALKGQLSLHSSASANEDSGTAGLLIEIRLPASLLSEHALMARVGKDIHAISSRHILDIHYLTPEQIENLGDREFYRHDQQIYPITYLHTLLGIDPPNFKIERRGYPALLTRTGSGRYTAVVVDALIEGREVVVKNLGPYVPKTPGLIGAIILGNGGVTSVLDLPELLRSDAMPGQFGVSQSDQFISGFEETTDAPTHKRRILIVDDSLSARRATAQLMRDAGYDTKSAIDGMEAVALLDSFKPDLILADMEMPRMNGLELTSHVRARSELHGVPIIMITSRSTDKHRQQAYAAGVSEYMTKPFSDEVLLEQTLRHIGAHA